MLSSRKRLSVRLASIALAAALFGGCATGTNSRDPFEPMNRRVYEFNEAVDRTYLQPAAYMYRTLIPQFVRSSISNFFSNINDIVVALNNLLQGKFTTAYSDLGRIAMNTTLGIGGLFDVASEAGIDKHEEDFGQTLGYWGIGDGPYIILPLLGPSNGRDAIGRFVDYKTDLITYVDPNRSRNQLMGTRIVNRRAELLDASTVLQTAALDPYEFVRDAYIQRRRNLIYDGAPPPDKEFMDPPPAPKKAAAAQPAFPSSAEPTGSGSILVSGESRAPVQSAPQYETRPGLSLVTVPSAPPASVKPLQQNPPASLKRESSRWESGEPLTPAQLEVVGYMPHPAIASDPGKPQELATLVRLWRSLVP